MENKVLGKVENIIVKKLEDRFQPKHMEVENESHRHHVPPGSETHFRVLLVSDCFVGLNRVQRSRMVHEVLAEELKNGVHALANKNLTSEEWQASEKATEFKSPNCLGKGQ